jgi:hypothetical protein
MGSKDIQKMMPEIAQDSPDMSIEVTFLSHDMSPLVPVAGARILPDATYDDKGQFDILLIPGGKGNSFKSNI